MNWPRRGETPLPSFGRLTLSLAVFAVAVLPQEAQSEDVPVFGRFESTVTNTRSYTNPFQDVSLDGTFTRPDGTTVDFFGF